MAAFASDDVETLSKLWQACVNVDASNIRMLLVFGGLGFQRQTRGIAGTDVLDDRTCYHTETVVEDQTCYAIQSRFTDSESISPGTDSMALGRYGIKVPIASHFLLLLRSPAISLGFTIFG